MVSGGGRCKAVIFDMDGVLVDSEELIIEAARAMFAERGLTVQAEDFLPFVGTGENRFIGGVAEKYDFAVDIVEVKKRTYDIYLEIIVGRLKPLGGVFEFIDKCRERGLKMAVASSADARKVAGNLNEIGLSMDEFGVILTGEDVEHKKPAPDIFLMAAKEIGIAPEDCLVVEDAVSGVAGAKAANSMCLGITSTFSREELCGADFFAADLAGASDEVLDW
ncbi:MAG: HAD-IA family hydrolase [Anaerohalosphaera sp.]|nr:HAD-IA family hydrolase [Anaerohalosphaera sp.]